ncbi:MAG TPA: PHB depolymerase family esterase [Labilithrix sp.]|nr:PHB depolymerase family esterase [Labilithrix sp.]
MSSRALLALPFATLLVLAASCGAEDSAPPASADGAAPPTGEGGPAPPDSGPGPSPDGAAADATSGAACTGRTGAAGTRTVNLTSGGLSRTFDLHVPAGYDPTKRTPLVFVFHGYTMTSAGIASATRFASVADKHGMIVAFPSGTGTSFNAGDCCGTAASSKVDDVGFTRDMIASIGAEYCVDAKRVFSTGFSNGGYLSYRLACELSDQIAAIAPVSGVLGVSPCTPKRPVPVLHIHGTSDLLVPYAGGGAALSPPVQDSVDAFRTKDACPAGDGKVVFEKDVVSCTSWGPCATGSDVELCTVTGGGHQWPGGELLPYGATRTLNLDASEAIATFFDAHPMP